MTLERGQDLEIRAVDAAPSIIVHSTATLPAGNAATVVNVGTAQNASVDFGIPQGLQGTQGIQGIQGTAGTNGSNGTNGTNGSNGTSPNITIGTVTTLAPGASATATLTGTFPNQSLNLGIPQGATGSGSGFAWGAATGTLSNQTDLQNALNLKAPLASPTFTGNPLAPTPTPGDNDTSIATTAFVTAAISAGGFAPLASPTFTGNPLAPTPSPGDNDTSIATTAFVTAAVAALLNNTALTGNPTAPTATAGDNDTSVATTAFVTTAVAAKAPLASPVFTGNPTAPTPTAGDNDDSLATTAFVHNELASYAPLAGAALTGNPTADGSLIGYRSLPTSRTVAANITLAAPDSGKKILISGTRTITLNPNATTAIDIDALGTIVNTGTGVITIARGTGVTAKLMGTGADANRSIAAGGVATWMKVGTDAYFVGGPGVS